jgi:hypothetical protein
MEKFFCARLLVTFNTFVQTYNLKSRPKNNLQINPIISTIS